MLAGLVVAVLFVLSGWLLPAATRAFKDLQFEIRHQFASAVVQEGTFTPVADRLTVYVRSRAQSGELTGILVQDDRDKTKSITIIADRGVLVETESGPRVVMENGTRQQLDAATKKLSMLTFDRYTLDLGEIRDAPVGREREPRERDVTDLWAEASAEPPVIVERHLRLAAPLAALSFTLLPLACLLTGEFNRRGQSRRILGAVALVFLFEAVDLGVRNAASRSLALVPLMYVTSLVPALVAAWYLRRDEQRVARRLAPMEAT
jgi:lipopolysaccharide export system permease protein